MSTNTIPALLMEDRYWRSMLHLFLKQPKLKSVLTTQFFNLETGEVKIQSLKRKAGPWSTSEKAMLNLALHLFNERNKFNLSDMDSLDDNNKKLAFEAIKIRFRYE
ncbi:hypothetical protein LS684_04250 [Cytobacillus spongiae]|uniref:hypothetical protein n=1 Tax=Cytobacillus spongiae TaxID=2901381 RepID=UPI001F431247|nr:hypothetical protein [Cytobacillus spongiae]UII56683.1 hypothetical protein LS684_04250 [Cytobacillus spongiae]